MNFTRLVAMRQLIFIFLFALASAFAIKSGAQVVSHAPEDTIRLGGIVMGTDTIPFVYMNEVEVHATIPKHLVYRREQFNRLKYNVQRVYPYAIMAASILKDVDAKTDGMEKRDRKAYLKIVEKELNKRFKGELQNLTITQGQILVKLIGRETGRNCFSIIKEVKGGFNAFVWQGVALLFSNNLKREYDPADRDRDIESIVIEIEAANYYQYKARTNGMN